MCTHKFNKNSRARHTFSPCHQSALLHATSGPLHCVYSVPLVHCLLPDAFIMPKVVEKRQCVVLTLKQKVDICRRLERGESKQQLMVEYGMGSSTIYDIKSQTRKLRDYMKATDTPKAAENRHTLQYHRGEMMDKVLYQWFNLKSECEVAARVVTRGTVIS